MYENKIWKKKWFLKSFYTERLGVILIYLASILGNIFTFNGFQLTFAKILLFIWESQPWMEQHLTQVFTDKELLLYFFLIFDFNKKNFIVNCNIM